MATLLDDTLNDDKFVGGCDDTRYPESAQISPCEVKNVGVGCSEWIVSINVVFGGFLLNKLLMLHVYNLEIPLLLS